MAARFLEKGLVTPDEVREISTMGNLNMYFGETDTGFKQKKFMKIFAAESRSTNIIPVKVEGRQTILIGFPDADMGLIGSVLESLGSTIHAIVFKKCFSKNPHCENEHSIIIHLKDKQPPDYLQILYL